MGIIKLQNAGDAVTWRIKKAETVAGKFGAQVKFENDSGDILFISEETAGRQLGRIPLDIDTCAGELLTFSRTENPKGGAPYWNITVADAVDRAAPTQSKRLSYSEAAKPISTPQLNPPLAGATLAQEKMRVARAYLDLFGYVKSQPEMQGVSDVAVQAASATIWIAWNQQGLTRAEPPKVEAPKPAMKPAKAEPDFSNFPPESMDDSVLPF